MAIWDSPENYKKCRKKRYTIHMCLPPKGTVVINKLEQADTVRAVGGRQFFKADELKNNPHLRDKVLKLVNSGRAYMTNDKTPFVLCGTVGEMWTISFAKLIKSYVFINDKPITEADLKNKMGSTGVLQWVQVATVPDNSYAFACFVSKKVTGTIQTSWGALLNINGYGVEHGKGDFVIAGCDNAGNINLLDRWVVNGLIFANTYNKQGWTDCLSDKSGINTNSTQLPKIY